MNHKVSSAELQKYLKDIDYPVDKEQLVEHAKQHGANQDVISLIEKMPEQEYNSPVDVNKAMSEAK